MKNSGERAVGGTIAKGTEIYNIRMKKLLCHFVSDSEQNAVFSLFPVHVLLGTLADATGSGTRQEIAKALGCEENAEELIEWIMTA